MTERCSPETDRSGARPIDDRAALLPQRPGCAPSVGRAAGEYAERAAAGAAALARLDELTRRLRRDCPWDREQDERSIVPHTVEEAYELADAAHAGDDAKLIDELGDVLFQVHFLALLLEERGAGGLEAVADGCREKLIRRHPHVFGEENAGRRGTPEQPSGGATAIEHPETAEAVLERWGTIKREDERGGEVFGDLPESLPAALYARKVLTRGSSAGLYEAEAGWGGSFVQHGDALLQAVEAAHADGVDPELALRHAADRLRADIDLPR
ncbi:MAG: nucleoside triphosphate pyrophosphohydrolase [Actinomycetota bacterium]|nr:nucleoside triphosphate pyrophosphohydrolase [Actinomycetota bacterium]